jgi:hypothetical protein
LFLQKNSKTTQERHKAYSFAVRAGKLPCEYGNAESDSHSETRAKEKTHTHTHTQDTQAHTRSWNCRLLACLQVHLWFGTLKICS